MSFAKPKPVNPATKFIDYKGETGTFQYYVKNEDGSGKNFEIKTPIKFLVIDELSTISGYSDTHESGIYSNEVHNIKKEILSVRTFKGNGNLIGTYDQIKDAIKSMGGKFAKSVYAMMVIDGKTELVNFKVKGAFLTAWIEAKPNTDREGILIQNFTEKKKGKNTYFEPVIETFIPDAAKAKPKAMELYSKLQAYFNEKKSYYEEQAIINDAPASEDGTFNDKGDYVPETTSDDDLPF